MGWGVKKDVVVDWRQNLLGSGTAAELPKPPPERLQHHSEFLKCPRCGSMNTKFCYYNNYNKSQPRYFCKACKRHWTKGGTLRNVPAGGGGRKNKRLRTSNPPSSANASAQQRLDCTSFPSITSNLGKKIMSNLLYQDALFRSASPILTPVFVNNPKAAAAGENGTAKTADSSLSEPPQLIENTEFPFSCLSTLDMNYSSPFPYWNLDSAEESSATSVNIHATTSLPNNNLWDWDRMDELSSPDFNIPWYDDDDDAQISYS